MQLSKVLLLIMLFSGLAFAQLNSSTTTVKIDKVENNTGLDIILNPTDKVDIQYFTGSKALQSTVDGELEESAVTNTELGYVSGVTSGIQGQIDGKQDNLPLTTNGDILYYNAGFARLPIGAQDEVLKVSASGFPEWGTVTSVSVTTKGDLQTYSTQPDRLGVGSDGQILSANSSTATGLEWIDFSASPTTTLGDLIYRGATEDVRLPIGSQDQLLSVGVTGEPVWVDPPSTSPTVSAGDIIYNDGTGAGNDTFLSIGSEGDVLTVNSGLPAWGQLSGTSLISKGELQSHNGMENEAVPAPTANGQYLVSDDTQNTGMKWDDSILAQVGQAHFVGGIRYTQSGSNDADCREEPTSGLNTWILPDISNCDSDRKLEGSFSWDTDSDQPSINVNVNAGTRYLISVNDLIYKKTVSGGQCFSGISIDGGVSTLQVGRVETSTSDNHIDVGARIYEFKAETTGSINIQYMIRTSVASNCEFMTRLAPLDIVMHAYPDSSQLVAFQETELTAQTANEFSAVVDSNGIVTSENYDWLNGNCTKPSANEYNCTFNSGVFSQQPSCVATSVGAANRTANISYNGASSILITMFVADNAGSTGIPPTIHCSKQGADVNKSQVVAGVFENINSSDLVIVRAEGLTAESITANTTAIKYTEVIDNTGSWNTDFFTSPRNTRYVINAGLRATTSTINLLSIWVDTGGGYARKHYISDESSNNDRSFGTVFIDLNAGDKLQVRVDASLTTNNDPVASYLTIQELPDTESIIKNLNDNNNVECQTKYLQGDITSNTGDPNESDMDFNNLEIGKKYRICYQVLAESQNVAVDNISLDADHNGVEVASVVNSFTGTSEANTTYTCETFTGAASTLTFDAVSISAGNSIKGDGTVSQTHATLCELPDNYIINSTKWN